MLWDVFKSRFKKNNKINLFLEEFSSAFPCVFSASRARISAFCWLTPSTHPQEAVLQRGHELSEVTAKPGHLAGPLHHPQIPSSSYHSDWYLGKIKDTACRMANADTFPCRNQGKQVETLQVAARPPSLCCHTGQSYKLWLLQQEKSPKASKLWEHTLPGEWGMPR